MDNSTTSFRSQNHDYHQQRRRSPKAKGRRNPRIDSEEEFSLSDNDDVIGEAALNWLDYYSKYDGSAVHLCSRRPGVHLQPISNRNPNHRHRPSPLQVREGKENTSSVTTAMRQSLRVAANGATKTTDKRYCATLEQAIDAKTRMVLLRMLNCAIFDDINGCISTGKQANVYHATKYDGQEFAVKVYKTSVLGFKDMDCYIQRDCRFRHGYCKHNPWKVAKTRAEKEMSNLMRLKAAGIRCPSPIHLKLHVLVMEFIGKSGWAAPRLKDANLSEDKMGDCYVQIIMVMRNLYRKCKLVHGDLSAYNILYYEGNLHIINVSQSVDFDHPLASDILREDCIRVSDFFRMNGVGVMTMWELFYFIVDSSITDESVECYLEKMQQNISFRDSLMSVEDWKMLRTLGQQKDAEEDVDRITGCQDAVDLTFIIPEFEHSLLPAPEQLQLLTQPNKWDMDNIFERTDISTSSGTESGIDEDDDSSDTQETLPAARKKNKRECASVEQAIDIDSRTRMVLFRMMIQEIFDEINGCISAGKQVNVYLVSKRDGQEFAVKVYKTSGFKGFMQGDCKQDRRKMIKTRAEKEMRNLVRLKEAGIKCPTPILLTLPVLVMEFIGKSGSAAPCLKDANLSDDEMRECYVQIIMEIRNLYQKCKLVHGNLSEYNILYYEGNLHIIDFSQSVDLDNPLASDILREDCIRVSDFFKMNGVGCTTVRELLDFIVDSSITDESVECYLEKMQQKIVAMGNVFPADDNAADCISEKQPKESDTNGTSTEQKNNFGAVSGTDEGQEDYSSDSKGVEPYDITQEALPADKKAARKKNKKKVKEGNKKAPESTQGTLPADKKAARKDHKKKVKEERREVRKSLTLQDAKKKKNWVGNIINRFP
ncbi:serine/threonine-protein kinase rio1-like isoform X1 [Papaver somniferum]|uniref:serine/threonine-protein kinase rio1-like isoform X1 n=1 Tax=Papaver somniferum TaxID=3469 RepID=UPI000E6F9FAA|nr:serine/threonine-protein kinase rio1-like isoform X1 [Papaver somniferum]